MNWDISFRETHDRDSGACVATGNTVFPSPKARKKKLMTTLGDAFVAIFTRFRLTYLLMQLGSIKHTNGSLPVHLYRVGLRRAQYFACPRVAFMKIQLSVNYRREITNIVARISQRLFYVRTEIYRPDPTRSFVRSFVLNTATARSFASYSLSRLLAWEFSFWSSATSVYCSLPRKWQRL